MTADGPTANYAVEATALGHAFGDTPVLSGVNLSVQRGEVVSVMGPSGSGKSTLLHCLAGLIVPDSGQVTVDGRVVTGLDDVARSRLRLTRIGYVPQFGDLVPELTLRENVELPLLVARRGRAARRDARGRAAELLTRLGVDDVADRRAGDVSGGQLQRAAAARALIHSPALVLADEPTGSLDTVTGERVLDALLAAAQLEGAGVLLVTHEARVAAHADRDVVLRDGRIRDVAELVP